MHLPSIKNSSKPPSSQLALIVAKRKTKCWFKHPSSQALINLKKKVPQSKKRKRDEERRSRRKTPKTNYMAVDEARVLHCFPRISETQKISATWPSQTSLLQISATRKDLSLDTLCSQHCFHDRSVFTSYQDIPFPQELKGYAGALQAKGISNVYIARSKGRDWL